ncbi:hypothetical protein AMJ44_10555 [candidate division WOR-1 bacterium DG_54_3]|uniref:Uncharacterized protein n=1 Tax=candidate division WOR-1 bacterium DG_54_3 TaxID=1703775 RepID=A0A0S7XS43_UNCSA|nr:MAG: hypothetical protein AMJ44_10555 [candidate division WOR-1 bacterium DG_54_3]
MIYGRMTIIFFTIIIIYFLNTYQRNVVWKEGTALWSDCVLKSPNKARPHYNLGTAYQKKDMLDEAISEYKRALSITPHIAEAHINIGNVYEKKDMLDEAISEYKRALVIKPRYAKAHSNLGSAYGRKGMLDEAILKFKKAITINPNYAKAHYNLGLIYDRKGVLDEAILKFKKAIAINPDYAEAYNNLAWIYATSSNAIIRNGDEAVALAIKACELTGFRKAEVLDTLAAAYAEKGIFEKAVEYQQRAIELAPLQIKEKLKKHLQFYKSEQVYRNQQHPTI